MIRPLLPFRLHLVPALLACAGFATAAEPAALRIVCVGDSITAGYGSPGTAAYPFQLRGLLGDGAESIINYGISGATLMKGGDQPYWKQMLTPQLPLIASAAARQPDIVLLMLGTNDAKPGNWAKKEAFAGDYTALVEGLRAARSHPTVYAMIPIPAFGEGNFTISPALLADGVVPLVRGTAAALHLPVIDLNAVFHDRADLVPDRVHPDAAGYRLIAETISGALHQRPVFAVRNAEFTDQQTVTIAPPAGAAAGSVVVYTVDGSLPTAGSTRYAGPFTVSATTTVTAAVLDGGTLGLPATATFTKAVPRPAVAAAGAVPGVAYVAYQGTKDTNIWRMEWDESLRVKVGFAPGISLDLRTRDNAIALAFSGLLTVPRDGVYTFSTTSDDGSTLAIGDEVVVDNGDMHGPRERSGTIALAAGAHPFALRYFNESGGSLLAVTWAGPGLERQAVPVSAFSAVPVAADPLPPAR